MQDRLADIGIDLPRQRPKPGFDGVQRLADRREPAPIDHALHGACALFDFFTRGPHQGQRGRDIAIGDKIRAEFLQRCIGIGGLVVGIIVEKCGLFVEQCLPQDRADGFPLRKPVSPLLGEELFGLGLVHRDVSRCPAIGEAKPVEFIQHAGQCRGRKAQQGQRREVRLANPRLQPACKTLISQHGIKEDRQFGNRYGMPLRRDAGVQIGKRLFIRERMDLIQGRRKKIEHLRGACLEMFEPLAPVLTIPLLGPLDQRLLGPARRIGRREPEQSEIIGALELGAGLFGGCASFLLNQPGCRAFKRAFL